MTMDVTPRWALPLLFAGQAQKEMFHNEALLRIDMMLHGRVQSADLSTAPVAPALGQCWVVAEGASGLWEGQAGCVACWTDGGWRFVAPQTGMVLTVAERGHAIVHDGTAWRDGALRADGLYIGDTRVVGPQMAAISAPAGGATIDSEGRLAIAAILAILRGHGLIAT